MTGALRKVVVTARLNGWKVSDAPVQSISLKRIIDNESEHQILVFFAWGGLKFDFALIYPDEMPMYRTQVLGDLLADLKRFGGKP